MCSTKRFDYEFPGADNLLLEQRAWVHSRDTAAISRIERRYAIGQEVAQRLNDFNGLDAEVLHPGLDIGEPRPAPIGEYFLMPGRLHRWKRVHLAIEAIKRSSLPINLRISGTGEEETALRELAGDDARIVFEGYVDDERLKELYAGALGVVFCPVSEDYGYVTIEAFAYGKPVITCTDLGEPLQFVSHGVTGLVAEPTPDSIREAMELLWSDREASQKMGTRAVDVAQTITWGRVARNLARRPGSLVTKLLPDRKHDRLKVAVLDMQPITPAIGGGRLRLLGLYHNLGDDFDVRYVGAYDWPGQAVLRQHITPSLVENVLPLSDAHYDAAKQAQDMAGGIVVIDLLFGAQAHLSPDYIKEAKSVVEWADVVVFSHPWTAPHISDEALDGKLIVYDAQNMEFDLRSRLLDANDEFQASIIKRVETDEALVGSRADLILVCSSDDADRFAEHYGWPQSKMEVVPNGVFANDFDTPDATSKAEARRRVGLRKGEIAALFIGSNYKPNIEATNEIVRRFALACPSVTFIVAGGVCSSLPSKLPANVRPTGYVSDEERWNWLVACDIALNPMMSGSGTNIKMFDYAAASLPIISTPIGARGIVQNSSCGIVVCNLVEMPEVINALAADASRRNDASAETRKLVDNRFSWERLTHELGHLLATELLKTRGRTNRRDMILKGSKIAHFSTVGQKCGIGEYTRHFMEALDELGHDLMMLTCNTPSSAPDLSGIEERSAVAWFNDNEKYSDTALFDNIDELVAASGVDYAIVQHHPAFLPPKELRRLATVFASRGVRMAVVTHSYTREQSGLLAELNSLGVPVLSHKKRDVIEAEKLGNLLLHIPLAIPTRPRTSQRTAPRDDASPIIVCNGFLREHKGIALLVEAFALVLKKIPGARLKLLCSLYPSADSTKAKQEVEDTISRFWSEKFGLAGYRLP